MAKRQRLGDVVAAAAASDTAVTLPCVDDAVNGGTNDLPIDDISVFASLGGVAAPISRGCGDGGLIGGGDDIISVASSPVSAPPSPAESQTQSPMQALLAQQAQTSLAWACLAGVGDPPMYSDSCGAEEDTRQDTPIQDGAEEEARVSAGDCCGDGDGAGVVPSSPSLDGVVVGRRPGDGRPWSHMRGMIYTYDMLKDEPNVSWKLQDESQTSVDDGFWHTMDVINKQLTKGRWRFFKIGHTHVPDRRLVRFKFCNQEPQHSCFAFISDDTLISGEVEKQLVAHFMGRGDRRLLNFREGGTHLYGVSPFFVYVAFHTWVRGMG